MISAVRNIRMSYLLIAGHAQSIIDGRPLDAADALHNLELILACYRSA